MNKNDAQQQRHDDLKTSHKPFEGAPGTWPRQFEASASKQIFSDHCWDLLLCSHTAIAEAHDLIETLSDVGDQSSLVGGTIQNRLATAQAAIEKIASLYIPVTEGSSANVTHDEIHSGMGFRQEIDKLISCLQDSAKQLQVQLEIQIDKRVWALPVGSLNELLGPALRRAVELSGSAPAGLRRVEVNVSFIEALCGRGMIEFLVADTGPRNTGADQTWDKKWHSEQAELVESLGGTFELVPIPADGGSVVHMQVPITRPGQQLAA